MLLNRRIVGQGTAKVVVRLGRRKKERETLDQETQKDLKYPDRRLSDVLHS